MRFLVALFATLALFAQLPPAVASERAYDDLSGFQMNLPNEPGKFDFYILALSWSPTFCANMQSQGRKHAQCSVPGLGFVVHGLWPQFRGGSYPANCSLGRESLDASLLSEWPNEDLKPPPHSLGLAEYEWNKHGTCSGLDQEGYFGLMKKAASMVRVPESFLNGNAPASLSEDDVKDSFLESNPRFSANQMQFLRDNSGRISDLLLCFSKALKPIPCE